MKIKEFIDNYTSRYSTAIMAISGLMMVTVCIIEAFVFNILFSGEMFAKFFGFLYTESLGFLITTPIFILLIILPLIKLLYYKNNKQWNYILIILIIFSLILPFFLISFVIYLTLCCEVIGRIIQKIKPIISIYLLIYLILYLIETRKNLRIKNTTLINSKVFKNTALIFSIFFLIYSIILPIFLCYNIN